MKEISTPKPLRIASVQAHVYRVPIDEPVQTSFGIMLDRPALVVRIEDHEGVVGWGEVWCNFPSVGAEHRARVLESVVAPILLEKEWVSPTEAFATLSKRLHILGIQSGEPGTIAQVIAGADIALWDMVGKKLGQPLWQIFGGEPHLQTYASGLSPNHPEKLVKEKWVEGYRAFKLKVGFGAEKDTRNLEMLRALLGPDIPIMIDANQAWSVTTALENMLELRAFDPFWIEEPIAADQPIGNWIELARRISIPLAAGENMRGHSQFNEAIESRAFSVLQPDLGKWGGFSGCIALAERIVSKGFLFCPHWLGGGIGLIASMHLKAAIGGDGFVEVDANPNPLRELLANPYPPLQNGSITLNDQPGLGIEPNLQAVQAFQVRH